MLFNLNLIKFLDEASQFALKESNNNNKLIFTTS